MMGTIESVSLNSNNWNTELEKDEEEKLEISELDHHHNSLSYNNQTYFPQSQQPMNGYFAAMPNGTQTASTSSSNFHGNLWSQEFNDNNYYIPSGEPIELRHHENPFPFNNQTETEWDPNYKNNKYSNCNAQFPQAQQPTNEYYVAMPNGPETGSTSSSNFHGNPCSQEFNDNNFYIPSGEPIGNNSNWSVIDAATKVTVQKIPRSRMSGAEMKLMTAQDKRQRQREHNKKNSHNLVIRRNEEKKELASRCENLNKQNEYYERIYNNQSAKLLEEYRDEIWPRYWNSSPYGNPNEFNIRLAEEMNRVSLENGKAQDLEKLRKKKDIARENCDKIFREGTNGINKNTYGSRKSRANGELKIAKGRYKAERLQTSICQTLSKINTLNNIIRELKRNFGHLQLDELVVDNVVSENYEPS